MTKHGTIEFDDQILDALLRDRLVIFAGAGVSIGPPSSLPNFDGLAASIAKEVGEDPPVKDPPDQFLGKLHHRGVNVHAIAAKLFDSQKTEPNSLHRNLTRMFPSSARVRLITTNYDQHFTAAAKAQFGTSPEIYFAPALPLGSDFSGIVHIHGVQSRPEKLVLTDEDFGRAYLTEGWARRFLLNLFNSYTVLFVGYSHEDTIMKYLARALPVGGPNRRFALTDRVSDWNLLGITPISFEKERFDELSEGVGRLADFAGRSALEWTNRLATLGAGAPPIDGEALSEVKLALNIDYMVPHLLGSARGAQWIRWLHEREYLDCLFKPADLGARDNLFAGWLAQHHALDHPEEVLRLLAMHGERMNQTLWNYICVHVARPISDPWEASAFKRWVVLLLANAPDSADPVLLMQLADRCASQEFVALTLRIFFFLGGHRLQLKVAFGRFDEGGEENSTLLAEVPLRAAHWQLQQIWANHLRPRHERTAEPILSGVVQRIEEMHSDLAAWGSASREMDSASSRRSAIEPHEGDRYPDAMDMLIDAARDALEWLAQNLPHRLSLWIESLVASDAPLLRRLALHAIAVHPGLSPDERLQWLLDRVGLHGFAERQEVRRLVASNYPQAADPVRQTVVESVLGATRPAFRHTTAEYETARYHFGWLSRLLVAKPDCLIATNALSPIRLKYPKWSYAEHPGLKFWESPWSVKELVQREPGAQLNDLQRYLVDDSGGTARESLLTNVRVVCRQNPDWAFALAQALKDKSVWLSELWRGIFHGLVAANLPLDKWRQLLTLASEPQLQARYPADVSWLLHSVLRDGALPFALELLDDANNIALATWQVLQADETCPPGGEWHGLAINGPAGLIVEFWLAGVSLLMRGIAASDRKLPEDYGAWFNLVLDDATANGGKGRSVLARQFTFLLGLDAAWTTQRLLPLFSDPDSSKFAQAWSGYLSGECLNPTATNALRPAIRDALPRLIGGLEALRKPFIEYYSDIAVLIESDPTETYLRILFDHASLADRTWFAMRVGLRLRNMKPNETLKLWDAWLHNYWNRRAMGGFGSLEEAEICAMLEWLPHLDEAYPQGIQFAIRCPPIAIQDCNLFYPLMEGDLVTRFPGATVDLLIYLCSCRIDSIGWNLERIAARIANIYTEDLKKLGEAFTKAGLRWPPPFP